MRDLWYQIGVQILTNLLGAIKEHEALGSGVLFFALVTSRPPKWPGLSIQAWYDWLFDALLTAMPIKFQRPLAQPTQSIQEKP